MSSTSDSPTPAPTVVDGRPRDAADLSPPFEFTDGEGRAVVVAEYDGEFDALVEMYVAFDDEGRAQGVPPRSAARVRSWLADVLAEGHHVVAAHGGRVVGHAMLLPCPTSHELAVFVDAAYRLAGIGSALVRALLDCARRCGVDRVWLVVDRNNRVAVNLYESVGFEVTAPGLEREMELELDP
ncbi:MAG: N-acetyltransferase family protein [Halobacteriaceae archaeon]